MDLTNILITALSVSAFIFVITLSVWGNDFSPPIGARATIACSGLATVFLFAVCLAAPTRTTMTEVSNATITKTRDVVLVEATIDNERIVEVINTAYFYNNVDKPGFDLVYAVSASPFHLISKRGFVLREKP